jgi:hypothetical protein
VCLYNPQSEKGYKDGGSESLMIEVMKEIDSPDVAELRERCGGRAEK